MVLYVLLPSGRAVRVDSGGVGGLVRAVGSCRGRFWSSSEKSIRQMGTR